MSEDQKKNCSSYLYLGEILVRRKVLPELEKLLCYQGGRIYQVSNDVEARAIIENYRIGAVIIDQYLPRTHGLDFMRWLHSFVMIPTVVILMDARTSDMEIVVALEAGAADAVQFDVSPRELSARIRASMRKYFHSEQDHFRGEHGAGGSTNIAHKQPLYFSPISRRLYFSDTSRAILHGKKEAELLELLIARHPAYIGREEVSRQIFRQPWNPNDRRIDNLISRLRKTIGASDEDTSESVIETVRNEGYRLRSPISLIHIDQTRKYAITSIINSV